MDDKIRNTLLESVRERNRNQTQRFSALVLSHNALLASIDNYRSKYDTFRVKIEQLKTENDDLRIKVEAGGGAKGEKTLALEQIVSKLKEELLAMHRKTADNAQKIIDMNNEVQEKDKQLQSKDARIVSLETSLTELARNKEALQNELDTQNTINVTLTDEQQALQLAFTALEGKFRKTQEEYNELVTRWMEYKAKDADRLNELNDKFVQDKRAKVQAQLVEAAKDPVNITIPPDSPHFPICVTATVPSHATDNKDVHDGEVHAIKWSPSGKLLATGGTDRKLKLWGVSNGKLENKGILTGSNQSIMSIDFDYEEKHILAASNDFACRVWTLSDQRPRHTLTGHGGKVLSAKFLGDPNKVVSGSHDRTLKIWDLRSKACVRTLFAGSSCNDIVTSDSQASNIMSGHFDKKIRFWDTRSESSAKEIVLNGRITSLDLSPDKTILLACTKDDSIKIIDLRMGQISKTLRADGFHVGFDWSRAVFSPDGVYVMAGSNDGTIFVWDVNKDKVEKQLKEHQNSVIACAWHPNGSMLASCDRQHKAVLWSDF